MYPPPPPPHSQSFSFLFSALLGLHVYIECLLHRSYSLLHKLYFNVAICIPILVCIPQGAFEQMVEMTL